jgi:acyl carrier protein
MTKDEVYEKLKDILVQEFEMEPAVIIPEAKLYDDLDLDSIDAVDIIVKMKQYIPDKIDPEQFKKVVTIQDVVEVVYPLVKNL